MFPFSGGMFSFEFPAIIYLFKVNNRNTKKRYEMCLKLTIKTPERAYQRRFGTIILLILDIFHIFF